MGNNIFVKIGENSFSSLTLAADSLIQETPVSSQQLDFQPGDVVGYYLEDNTNNQGRNPGAGVQFDVGFTSEELWYATGNSNLQTDNSLKVGNTGDLSMSTSLGPIISVSLSK